MIRNYNAPYILKKYNPHFTLLTNVPEEQQDNIAKELNNIFNNSVADKSLLIDSVSIMDFHNHEKRWYIK